MEVRQAQRIYGRRDRHRPRCGRLCRLQPPGLIGRVRAAVFPYSSSAKVSSAGSFQCSRGRSTRCTTRTPEDSSNHPDLISHPGVSLVLDSVLLSVIAFLMGGGKKQEGGAFPCSGCSFFRYQQFSRCGPRQITPSGPHCVTPAFRKNLRRGFANPLLGF